MADSVGLSYRRGYRRVGSTPRVDESPRNGSYQIGDKSLMLNEGFMHRFIKKFRLFRRDVLDFNQRMRDKWVESEAKRIPAGSSVLGIGAGECRYKNLFRHCNYKAQDFCQFDESITTYGDFL